MRENILDSIELEFSEAITQIYLESQKEIFECENKMKKYNQKKWIYPKSATLEKKKGLPIKPRRSSIGFVQNCFFQGIDIR